MINNNNEKFIDIFCGALRYREHLLARAFTELRNDFNNLLEGNLKDKESFNEKKWKDFWRYNCNVSFPNSLKKAREEDAFIEEWCENNGLREIWENSFCLIASRKVFDNHEKYLNKMNEQFEDFYKNKRKKKLIKSEDNQ